VLVLAAVDVGAEAESDLIRQCVGIVLDLLQGDHAVGGHLLGLGRLDGHGNFVLSHRSANVITK